MTLNTGIVMILMMIEIKSIFNAEIFKDLSEKKTRTIMLTGLVVGIFIDLPVEISWFVYNFDTKETGLAFIVYYICSAFSLLFFALTLCSLKVI